MKENIFLKNGTLFATEYNRIVHGERGDYVHLVRYKGCGMSATVRSIDTLELIDDYFSNSKKNGYK